MLSHYHKGRRTHQIEPIRHIRCDREKHGDRHILLTWIVC